MQHVNEGTLHAYLDARERPAAGALEAEQRASVEQHVAECASCAAALVSAERVRARAGDVLLGAAPVLPELPAFPSLEVPAPAPPRRTWVPLAWAASVLLAAGGGWMGSGLWRAEDARRVPTESGPAASAPLARQAPPASETRADATIDAGQQSAAAPASPTTSSPRPDEGGRVGGTANPREVRAEADAAMSPPPATIPATVAAAPQPVAESAGVSGAVEAARVASEKGRAPRAFVEPQRTAVQLEALVVTGGARAYPGDDDVAWSEIGLAEARRLLADTLLLVPDAAVEHVARDWAGRVRVRQRDAAGEIELVQWRSPGPSATDAPLVMGVAADGHPFALVERGGSTVALRASSGRVAFLVQQLARRGP